MKYCKDCVWILKYDDGPCVSYLCLYGAKWEISKVDGIKYVAGQLPGAQYMRNTDKCGGKHYKRVWWKFWRPK
jgi:hypothetical protein